MSSNSLHLVVIFFSSFSLYSVVKKHEPAKRSTPCLSVYLLDVIKLCDINAPKSVLCARCGKIIKILSLRWICHTAQSQTNGTQSFISCKVLSQIDILMQIFFSYPFSHRKSSDFFFVENLFLPWSFADTCRHFCVRIFFWNFRLLRFGCDKNVMLLMCRLIRICVQSSCRHNSGAFEWSQLLSHAETNQSGRCGSDIFTTALREMWRNFDNGSKSFDDHASFRYGRSYLENHLPTFFFQTVVDWTI